MLKEDIDLFNSLVSQLLEEEQINPVVRTMEANLLTEKLDLGLSENPMSRESFCENLKSLIRHTPKTSSNRFFNQLFGGRNSKATLGELLSVMLNNSMYTFKAGGPMILLQKELILKMCALAGYDSDAYGTMAPGGSMTNLMGMLMARDKLFPQVRTTGVTSELTMYTSKECHYSIKKNASFMGVGAGNIRYISTDDKGSMDSDKLEKQIHLDIENGKEPFLIIGTAGTTVMGAIDPIKELSAISKKYGLWFHLDAAFYGSILFSDNYKYLLDGIELTDSFSFNAHKLLSTPLSCSFILTQHKKCLYDSFNSDADYLFQEDEDDLNPGKMSMLCGRRNDALKLWVLWKLVGTKQIGNIIDHEFKLADIAREYIRSNNDYTLYSFDNSITVCFNYKDVSPIQLCKKLNDAGEIMVGYGKFKGEVFIRLVLVNSQNSKEDIINFFERLEAFADKHFKQKYASY